MNGIHLLHRNMNIRPIEIWIYGPWAYGPWPYGLNFEFEEVNNVQILILLIGSISNFRYFIVISSFPLQNDHHLSSNGRTGIFEIRFIDFTYMFHCFHCISALWSSTFISALWFPFVSCFFESYLPFSVFDSIDLSLIVDSCDFWFCYAVFWIISSLILIPFLLFDSSFPL